MKGQPTQIPDPNVLKSAIGLRAAKGGAVAKGAEAGLSGRVGRDCERALMPRRSLEVACRRRFRFLRFDNRLARRDPSALSLEVIL